MKAREKFLKLEPSKHKGWTIAEILEQTELTMFREVYNRGTSATEERSKRWATKRKDSTLTKSIRDRRTLLSKIQASSTGSES